MCLVFAQNKDKDLCGLFYVFGKVWWEFYPGLLAIVSLGFSLDEIL